MRVVLSCPGPRLFRRYSRPATTSSDQSVDAWTDRANNSPVQIPSKFDKIPGFSADVQVMARHLEPLPSWYSRYVYLNVVARKF